jgi:hypothetical protein
MCPGSSGNKPMPDPRPPYSPYGLEASNEIYNLLFCDDPKAFAPRPGETPADWQAALFTEPESADRVRALAGDASMDARVRVLACAWLRTHGHAVEGKDLLGVIVEVPLDGGLDTLAAFADEGVRYINQTGKMSIFEGPIAALSPRVKRLFEASRAVVARIGPWDKARMPPPRRGHVRLTFLVSDGLYFGEGELSVFQRDSMAGPVIHAASELLQQVVALTTR